jgi:hypothetical protein
MIHVDIFDSRLTDIRDRVAVCMSMDNVADAAEVLQKVDDEATALQAEMKRFDKHQNSDLGAKAQQLNRLLYSAWSQLEQDEFQYEQRS